MRRVSERPGWAYSAAIVLFVAVFAFAVLGLVRSSSRSVTAARRRLATPLPTTPFPTAVPLLARRAPTPQIPPSIPDVPTQPPSRTYVFPPPELASTPPAGPGGQPRR